MSADNHRATGGGNVRHSVAFSGATLRNTQPETPRLDPQTKTRHPRINTEWRCYSPKPKALNPKSKDGGSTTCHSPHLRPRPRSRPSTFRILSVFSGPLKKLLVEVVV